MRYYIKDIERILSICRKTFYNWEKAGKVCCISLIKAEDFTEMVKGMLGPMMKEVVSK